MILLTHHLRDATLAYLKDREKETLLNLATHIGLVNLVQTLNVQSARNLDITAEHAH
jgi:hypothetical protein